MNTVASVSNLNVHFGHVHILKDVSLRVGQNSVVGLVGESGSGKSTLAKVLIGLLKPTSGSVKVLGHEMGKLSQRQRKAFSRSAQLIPQDPYSSLSPRRTIGQTLAEAIDPRRSDPKLFAREIASALEMLQINPDCVQRYPHEFSGGQRQRIAIARALIVEPKLIIADEITSALDVSVQAEVIGILQNLRGTVETSMLFVTHNLAVAQQVCDTVAVMNQGEIVEYGPINEVYQNPQHEYTQKLLASVPGSRGYTLDRVPA